MGRGDAFIQKGLRWQGSRGLILSQLNVRPTLQILGLGGINFDDDDNGFGVGVGAENQNVWQTCATRNGCDKVVK